MPHLCATVAVALSVFSFLPLPAEGGTGRNAFALPFDGLSRTARRAHAVGNSFFNQNWVQAPASAQARDGLGPFFQARSCSACHFKDGRGAPPSRPDQVPLALLFRVSTHGGAPHPIYGDQLNQRALPGTTPEATAQVTWTEVPGTFTDGSTYSLRKLQVRFEFGYGQPGDGFEVSPRVAQPVFGLGLLEAVSESSILALADPDDTDGDGISGGPNRVFDLLTGKEGALGRFGWKAGQPGLRQQAATAFRGDIGITSTLCPEENATAHQEVAIKSGGEPEVSDKILDHVTTYLRTLAPPARRGADSPQVKQGETLFSKIGCAQCHIPELQAAPGIGLPELAGRTFTPYTDLLLHDMGEDLADHRVEAAASGREWRTPPLWGIGLTETVNGHTNFLHDGRARDVGEAILWHGGEAEKSRDAYRALTSGERSAVLAFVNSL